MARNYKEEYRKYHSKPEQIKNRAARNAAHSAMEEKVGHDIKQDVDHKKPISKGGKNNLSNLRIQSKHENRSYKRQGPGGKPK